MPSHSLSNVQHLSLWNLAIYHCSFDTNIDYWLLVVSLFRQNAICSNSRYYIPYGHRHCHLDIIIMSNIWIKCPQMSKWHSKKQKTNCRFFFFSPSTEFQCSILTKPKCNFCNISFPTIQYATQFLSNSQLLLIFKKYF